MRSFVSVAALLAAMSFGAMPPPVHAQAQGAHSLIQRALPFGAEAALQTGPRQSAEVIFPDGTSVILAPGAAATFRSTGDGRIEVTLTQGLMRVSGGASPSMVGLVTPHAMLTLVNGAAIVEVAGGRTRTHLLNGEGMRISSGGTDRLIFRPGFQVVAGDGVLSFPRRIDRETLVADILALSEGLTTGTRPNVTGQRSTPNQTGSVAPPPPDQQTAGVPGFGGDPDLDLQQDITQPVPEVAFDLAGGLGTLDAFAPGVGIPAGTVSESSTTTVDANFTRIRQNYIDETPPFQVFYQFEFEIFSGPTTNRLFGGHDLAPVIQALGDLGAICTVSGGGATDCGPGTRGLGYYFATTTAGLVSDFQQFASDTGLIRLSTLLPNGAGVIDTRSFHQVSAVDSNIGIPILRADTTFGPTNGNRNAPDAQGIWNDGAGVIVRGLNFNAEYRRASVEFDGTLISAPERKDNFIFLDMSVLKAINWVSFDCVTCKDAFDAVVAAKQAEYNAAAALLGLAPATMNPLTTFNETSDFGANNAATGAALIQDPRETRRYLFATGELNEMLEPGASTIGGVVHRFALSAGLEGPVRNGITGLVPGMHMAAGNRAFLRAQTWTDLASLWENGPNFDNSGSFGLSATNLAASGLVQTPFFIVYPGGDLLAVNAPKARVFHADLGLKTVAGRQVSTVSATIGEVTFRNLPELNGGRQDFGNERMVDAILSMKTIGSSRALDATGAPAAAVLAFGDVSSTAAGGGNPNLGTGGVADPGRLGFFVLENAGQVFDDVQPRGPLTGGTERPIGGDDQQFALLRLGVATGSTVVQQDRGAWISGGDGAQAVGYGAAILDVQGAGGAALGTLGAPDQLNRSDPAQALAPNMIFSDFNSAANSFMVELAGVQMGGEAGASAYVDDANFGARSTGGQSELALISGQSVVAGVDQGVAGSTLGAATQGYQHTQWGFFFGDTSTATGARQHAHLGSYAAGARLGDAEIQQIAADTAHQTAVMRYEGHAVGNVLDNGNLRTATGTYREDFSFGTRQGSAAVDFDGKQLTGASFATADLRGYTGNLAGGGFIGELNGTFTGPAIAKPIFSGGAGTALSPAGIVGSFSIAGGTADEPYRAVGTFAGE